MKEATEKSYFQKRMDLLGINETNNQIELINPDAEFPIAKREIHEVFKKHPKGIEILVYTLSRHLINYAKVGDGQMSHINAKIKHYSLVRLEVPKVKDNGEIQKYDIPKGMGTHPLIPPMLIDKYERKEEIHTLYMTEGYFKAFMASLHGLDIVGLSSITHYKDKETGGLHQDIIKIILTCKVKRVVWLVDGDCSNISTDAIKDSKDLYLRPFRFFSSTQKIKQLLDDYDVEKYFAKVNSESVEGEPKGLDDLLVAMKGSEAEVIEDLKSFSKTNRFFTLINISFNVAPLRNFLHLNSVDNFYLFHVQKRPELKDKDFIFNGTKYKWNEDKNICEVIIPGEAKLYFRVGDQYHRKLQIPNKYGQLDSTFHRIQKGTIIDDYGRKFIEHIPKYLAFCNVPDHTNFQDVIYGCYNIYAPFEHEPEEGDCPNIIEFLKHIFGNGTIHYKDHKTGEQKEIGELDLGLDYMQLLYQRPTQILPILCLVSRENGTGKTTLAKLCKMIYTQNAAIVGNAELADSFNASWASKLLIFCDEAKIDKQVVVEKVKSLSTADKIFMNAKGKDHVEIDFFGKFVFMTNNEDNFIYASDDDVRYWIRKVPVVKDLNVKMIEAMKDEIPAFLNFLNQRNIKSENKHRGWFDPNAIKTEALKKVIQYSMPTIEKELRHHIREIFFDFGLDEFSMTRNRIHEEFFKKKYEVNYIENVLKDRLKVDQYHTIDAKGEKEYKTHRYSYPKWERRNNMGTDEIVRVEVKDIGRPFVFKVTDFLTPEEIKQRAYDPETKSINDTMNAGLPVNGQLAFETKKGDVPF